MIWISAVGWLLVLASQATDPAALLRSGRYQEALTAVQSELKAHPEDPRLLTMEGIALAQLGKESAALKSYRRALSGAPDYLPALEGAAQIEYKTHDGEAFVHLDRLLKINAQDETAHAMRGVLEARAGRCEQGAADFGAAPNAIAKKPDALRQYGTCLFRLRRWNEAERTFTTLLAADAGDKRAAYGVASSQIEAGEFEQAVATLKPFADDAEALALSANALEALGRTPDAIADLRSAIVTDPKNESFYTQFAELCFTYKSYQAGVDVLSAGLTQLPNSAKLYVARGVLLVQQGNYESADADFAKAERLDPREGTSADAAVLALVQANRLAEADHTLDEKLKQHPRDSQLFFLRADVLSREGDVKGSLAAVNEAIRLRPDFVVAHDLLARLYLQKGDEMKAIAECQAALSSDPNDETALYRWLRILSGRHRGDEVKELAQVTERWRQARERQKQADLRESRYRIFTEK